MVMRVQSTFFIEGSVGMFFKFQNLSTHEFFGDEQDPKACKQDLFLYSNRNLILFPSKRQHLHAYIMDDDLNVDEEDVPFGEEGGMLTTM